MAKRPMPRPTPPRPTNAELEILRVLWRRGPCTVRVVHESFGRAEPIGYTTVLKLLQIMTAKGLVQRDPSLRSHVYSPPRSEASTHPRLVADLVRRGVGGSAGRTVVVGLFPPP